MSTTQSYGRWFMNYALLCATLLFVGQVTGEVSRWAGKAMGGTDCDSLSNFTKGDCTPVTGKMCGLDYLKCDKKGPGLATRICEEGKGNNSCTKEGICVEQKDDKLNPKDANGNPCVQQQLNGT